MNADTQNPPHFAAGVLAWWPRACGILLFLLCAALTWRPLEGGEDFWAHAAVGRWIWQHHGVPRQTLWLWGAPPQPWIAHSWLSELFFYAAMRVGGAHGVLIATIAIVFLPFYWAWKLWAARGASTSLGALYFAFALTCASVRFQPRPELFSYFFLAVLLRFLIAWTADEPPPRAQLFGIAALFALWANCHGGVALGLAVLVLAVIGEALQNRFDKEAKSWRALQLGGLLTVCVAAVNLNPYGMSYWKALRPVGGAMFKMIDEWKPPLAAPALPFLAVVFVASIFFVAFFAWLQNPKRRVAHLLWLCFFGWLFLSARRNLWPAILVFCLVAGANANGLNIFASKLFEAQKFSRAFVFLTRAIVLGVLCLWSVSMVSSQAISMRSGSPQLRAVSDFAPAGVANFVLQNHPSDPIFNDYLRSGYFHWRFAGHRKLFIDLQNAYPSELLAEYFQIIARTPRGQQLFEQKKINTVIFGRWQKVSRVAPLAEYLNRSPQWKRVHFGDDGAVWVRRAVK